MHLPKGTNWFKIGVPVKTVVYQLNSSRVEEGDTVKGDNSGWEIFLFFFSSLNIYYTDRTKNSHSDAQNKAFTYPYLFFSLSWIKHKWYVTLCTNIWGKDRVIYSEDEEGNYETWNESKWYKLKAFR